MQNLYHKSKKNIILSCPGKLIPKANGLAKGNLKKLGVTAGSFEALQFIVKYCEYFADKEELSSIEYPLPVNVSLADLFIEEQDIFGELLNVDISNDSIEKNATYAKLIVDIIRVAGELEMMTLVGKMCAIFNYYLRTLPLEHTARISEVLDSL